MNQDRMVCLVAIIEKRSFLNGWPTVSPWDGRECINPEAVATADRALAHGRGLKVPFGLSLSKAA